MIVIERTLSVAAAPAVVLDYLRDFTNTQEWIRAVRLTVRDGSGPVLPGTTWRQSRRVFGVTSDLAFTLVEDAPGRLVFHGRNETTNCLDTITIRPLPTGSEINYRVDLELHGLAKLASPWMRIQFEKLGTECATGLSQALTRLTGAAWRPSTLPPPAPA